MRVLHVRESIVDLRTIVLAICGKGSGVDFFLFNLAVFLGVCVALSR